MCGILGGSVSKSDIICEQKFVVSDKQTVTINKEWPKLNEDAQRKRKPFWLCRKVLRNYVCHKGTTCDGCAAKDANLIAMNPFNAKSELFLDCWWLM